MVKVCHITSVHKTNDVRIFRKECTSLSKNGYDVYLVGQGDSREENGVHIIGVGENEGGRLNRMFSFSKKVYKKALAVDADIYHFHDPELLPYGLKLKKKGKKVIFDSHERYTEQLKDKPYLPSFVTKLIAKMYGVYENRVLKKIDAVVFPCTINGKDPFENKCKISALINNAVLLEEFYEKYDPSYKKLDNTACYVGSLSRSRGITTCIQAMYKAKANLVLGGRFNSKAYEDETKSMEEFSCVSHRGELDRNEVFKLLSESRVGLFVLKDQGQYLKIDTFGVKVYEYMSMGLPVVLSHSPYNDEMVKKYCFGICVDPESIDEIANAVRYILDNPDKAREMGENGRRAVVRDLNWAIEQEKLLALYEKILTK